MKQLLVCVMLFAYLQSNSQTWKPNPKYVKADTAKHEKLTFQCYGTTHKGERCKRHVKADHSYCYQHITQSN